MPARSRACLREAVLAVAALGRAGALTRRAARGPARVVGDVDVGEVAGRRLRGEPLEPLEVASERRAGSLVEQRPPAERDAQLRPAHVLRPALQQRGGERDAAVLAQVGEVLVPELVLQRQRRGRHDDLAPRGHRRREVREPLARSGRRLGDEMVAAVDRVGRPRPRAAAGRAGRRRRARPPRPTAPRRRVEPPALRGSVLLGLAVPRSSSTSPRSWRLRGRVGQAAEATELPNRSIGTVSPG